MRTNPPPRRHDVVIVGARAAGAATALLLARAGLDVLVVDRAATARTPSPPTRSCAPGVVQLHRWGLLDAVVAAGTPPVRTTTFTLRRRRGRDRHQAVARRRRAVRAAAHGARPDPRRCGPSGRRHLPVRRDGHRRPPRPQRQGRRHRRSRRSGAASAWQAALGGRRRRHPLPAWRPRSVRPPSVQGTGATAVVVRLLDRARTRRVRVDLPARRLRRRHPDQRRPLVRLRRGQPGPDRARRPGRLPRGRPRRVARAGRRGWPTPSARPASAPSAGSPATSAGPTAGDGRSWATPATGRTRSAPTA